MKNKPMKKRLVLISGLLGILLMALLLGGCGSKKPTVAPTPTKTPTPAATDTPTITPSPTSTVRRSMPTRSTLWVPSCKLSSTFWLLPLDQPYPLTYQASH